MNVHPDEKHKQKIIIGSVVFFSIIGLLLVANAFTGFIISESCCFPPNCPLENICDSARPLLESPGAIHPSVMSRQDLSLLTGIALVVVSVGMYAYHKSKMH